MTPEQKEHFYGVAERLIAEQNLPFAAMMGAVVMLALTAAWVGIAAYKGQIMGYLVIAIGAGIGYAIQVFGKGLNSRFVILACVLTFLSCMIGNILAAVAIEAIDHQMPVMEILGVLNLRAVSSFIFINLGLLDLAFWIVAVSVAGYAARRRLNQQEHLAIFTRKHTPRPGTGTS